MIEDGGEQAADGVEQEKAGGGAEVGEGDAPFAEHAAGEEFGAGGAGEQAAFDGRGTERAVDFDGKVGDGGFGGLAVRVEEDDIVVFWKIRFGFFVDAAVRGFVVEEHVCAVHGAESEGNTKEGGSGGGEGRGLEFDAAIGFEQQAQSVRSAGPVLQK